MMFRPKTVIKILAAMALAALAGGCGGTVNDSAPAVDPVRGKHPDTWVYNHRAYYHTNTTQCNECHGSDLKGGITRIDCFNQNADSRCHAIDPSTGKGHGPRNITHTLPFTDPTLHGPQARADLVNCEACHGEPGIPGSNPRYNLPIGSLPHGCETCHPTNAGHPAPWSGHKSAGNLPHACDICHGINLQGGNGPKCANCHTSLAVGDVPVAGQCVSCHGKPPNGGPGAVAPNIAGAHIKHNSLTKVTNICDTCHSGGGTGTGDHGKGTVHVSFLPVYNAKSGTASYDSAGQKCSKISCHGGQDTPAWGGSINVSAECEKCHILGQTEYNSYYSGKHEVHLTSGWGLHCTHCHDPAKLVRHFDGLDTPEFEGSPADTLYDKVQYNKVNDSCSPPTDGSLGTACHFPWKGIVRPWFGTYP